MSRSAIQAVAPLVTVLLAGSVGFAAGPPAPRFAGEDATVAVSRASGKVVVCALGRLRILDSVDRTEATLDDALPGTAPYVVQFAGNTILVVTHDVNGMPRVFVALYVDGRERLAWPNDGISSVFPGESSALSLDGKGVAGALVLDEAVRAALGVAADIPLGAGVAASYRFSGERLLVRASETFREVVALAPDDMLITLRGGGLLRYGPAGVAWKTEDTRSGEWVLADVDAGGKVALVHESRGGLVAVDTDTGRERWRWSPPADAPALRGARLLRGGLALVTLGGGERRTVRVLDPGAGTMRGGDLVAGFAAVVPGVAETLARLDDPLAAVLEVTGSDARRFLVRGKAGWYLLPLPSP